MKKQNIQSISMVLGLVLLSSCANRSTYKAPEVALPEQWQAGASVANIDEIQFQQWWQQFNDSTLNQLIRKAIAKNLDLKIAQAQLREARALANIVSGNQGPEVSASASARRAKGSSTSGGSSRTVYDAGFDASWEVDIFGAQRNELKAAKADVEVSKEALHNTRVSLVAEVARSYVTLRVNEYRLLVAQSNVKALEETYQLAQWKYQAGLISALDESLAQTQLEQIKASLPLINNAIVVGKNSLAILLGKMPNEINVLLSQGVIDKNSTEYIPSMNNEMLVGIPADTIRQRPDVRSSERKLAAQTARLSAAEAARYPSLNLTGSIGVEALTLGRLGNSNAATYSLMAGITAPIFNAGRIRSNIERQDALLEQSRLSYQSAVLTALADVENALSSLTNNQQRKNNLLKAADSAKNSLELTQYQYQSGLIDFQTLLENQRNLLGLQDQLASAIGDYSLSQITLYKSLGGGWQSSKEHKNKETL